MNQLDDSLGSIASHAKAAVLAGLIGLVFGAPITEASYQNGRLVSCSSFDAVKLAFGVVAIGLGVLTLVRRDEYSSRLELLLGVAALAFGAIAVLVSFGIVGTACDAFS